MSKAAWLAFCSSVALSACLRADAVLDVGEDRVVSTSSELSSRGAAQAGASSGESNADRGQDSDQRKSSCTPACDGKECGDDGCGHNCGHCTQGKICSDDGACVCKPHATSRCHNGHVRWFDSCDVPGEVRQHCNRGCSANSCTNCVPSCNGKQCGGDGCGGSCGDCAGGNVCTPEGTCACGTHFETRCEGSNLYWFDSCGTREDLATACEYGCHPDGFCYAPLTVTLLLQGDGRIEGVGLPACTTSPCTLQVAVGAKLSLSAIAQGGTAFAGWGGDCSGGGPTCTLVVDSDKKRVIASFGPPGPPNLIFMTSTAYPADFGNNPRGPLQTADDACAAAASAANRPGHYKAWLLDSTVATFVERIGPARGWIRPDGKPVIDTISGALHGVGWYAPNFFADGSSSNYSVAYTGGEPDLSFGDSCSDWTTTSGRAFAGIPDGSANNWTGRTHITCDLRLPFFCVGTDYVSQVSPTRSTGRLAFIGTGFVPSSGLAAADALCANQAASAGHSGSFKALLATSTASAASRFDLSGPTWVTPDGLPIYDTAANLASNRPYLVPIAQAADASWISALDVSLAWIWSGARYPTVTGEATCGDWTDANAQGISAFPGKVDGEFFGNFFHTDNCTRTGGIVCLEN